MITSSRSRHGGLGVLLACALAAAACGSTVQTRDQTVGAGSAQQGGSGAALGTGGLGGVTTPDNRSSGVLGGSVGGGGSSGVGVAVGGSGTPAPGGTVQGTPGATPDSFHGGVANGPGVTATTIALGIPYCNDCAQATAATGFGSDDPGDLRRYYNAALDEVNTRGGVLGRKLVPVFHPVSVKDNADVSFQAACATFTQDNKVAVIFGRGDIMFQCAKRAGVIAVGSGATGAVFQRYPNVFSPSGLRLERLGVVTVQAMVERAWQKPEAPWPTGKIGIVTWDTIDYHYAIDRGWLPALHASGLKETEVRYISPPQSQSLADASAAISAAVLAFRQRGIDHVFLADGPAGIIASGGITTLFVVNAESQHYYPRYGFSPNNTPEQSNQLPADEMAGMLGIAAEDGAKANDVGIAQNQQRERCFQLMRRKGLTVHEGKMTSLYAIIACETAWFSEAVLKRATGGTTLPKVIAAAESLGTAYRSPGTFGTKLGASRHDGQYLVRNGQFEAGCSCFKYSSIPYEP